MINDYRERLHELGIDAYKSGKYLCPKCSADRSNNNDRCLSVTFESDHVIYNCHNDCGFKGSIWYSNQHTPKIVNAKTYRKPQKPKSIGNKQALYNYFEKRGISKETIDSYDVGINDKKEMTFPYYKDGELVNIKYRVNLEDGKKKFKQEANAEKTFYAMDIVEDFRQLVICEGEIDTLSLAEAGIEAVSVPQGASEKKLECIENCYDWLCKFDSYVIAVDNDDPGRKLQANLLDRLDKYKCKIVDFGIYKDANELLLAKGKEALYLTIKKAEYIKVEGITDFLSNKESIDDFYYNGYAKGYSTGWSNLDSIFTIKTGYLMIVTGIPSRGKSFFVDNLLMNLSLSDNLKHLVCSFENTPESHFARLASMYKEKKFSATGGMSPDDVNESMTFINEHFLRLETNKLWDVDQIIDQIEYAVRRFNVNTLTIDPYNRLDNPVTDREDKYIGRILTKLSMIAKKLNILVIFIAHPKKIRADEKEPNMYSISGSADWYNMADYGVIIHRDREVEGEKRLENKTKVIVQKVKDFHLGNPSGGEAFLEYDPNKYKLVDLVKMHGNW